MTVAQLAQHLESLRFDSHEQARVMLDPGIQNFLIRATKAAAVDRNAKVRHTWRLIAAVVRRRTGSLLRRARPHNEPERTSSYFQRAFDPLQCLVLSLGEGDETALQSRRRT
jgi:hypothetical protein